MPQSVRTCEAVGASGRPQSDSTSGIMLGGKYDIKKKIELYKGSVSTVYKCLLAGGAPVVVKTYHKAKMADKHFHKLEREVAAMRALCREVGKRGVVQLMDTYEDSHGIYLVMECCEGGDLFKRLMLSGGKMPENWVAVEVIAPLLRVLDRMHDLHLIHRDIKPENLFITAEGEVKLGDFGLAIDCSKELPFSRSGTLDYMAPEVLMNPATHTQESPAIAVPHLLSKNIRPYTTAVDVWAVGCLAYELVCGRPPFEVEDEKQTASLIIYSNNIRFDPSASPAWADFVTQALIKDPRQRPDAATLLGHHWIRGNLDRAAASQAAAAAAAMPLGRDGSAAAADAGRNGGRTSGAPQPGAAAASVASSGGGSSACGGSATASVTDLSSIASGATTAAATAVSQRTAAGTPSAAATGHGTTAHGFRTAAAMLANRASQQQGCMTPPPALSTSAATPTSPGMPPPGSLYVSAPSSAPPTQQQQQHQHQQQRGQPASPSGTPHRAGNLGGTGALRSLLDAFKSASLNSSVSGSGSGGGAGTNGATAATAGGSGSGTERSRPTSGARPPSTGGSTTTATATSTNNTTSSNNSASIGSILRTSFQFQKSTERETAASGGNGSTNTAATAKLLRASFQVQIPTGQDREPSLGGISTTAVVGCRTPSGHHPREQLLLGPPEALPRCGHTNTNISTNSNSNSTTTLAAASAHDSMHSASALPSTSQPAALQLPSAPGAAAMGGGGSAGGFTSPSRMGRNNAVTTGGLASGSGSSNVHLSSFLRPVTSLSAAGGCNSGPGQGPHAGSDSVAAAMAAAASVGLQGKPPRPHSESPGKAFGITVAASVAGQGAGPTTNNNNNAISPLRRAIHPSPPRVAPPSVSPPRLQPSASPPRLQPSASGSRGGDWAAVSGGAGQPSSATLHDLTRSWGAVVSISVGKYGNPVGGGGYPSRANGSGSAFNSPQRAPVGGGPGGKMLDSYGLPPPTPVASGLPPAEYCSPRPSGVLERVKYHLRGGAPGTPGGVMGGQQQQQVSLPGTPGGYGGGHVIGTVPVDVM